MQYNQVWNTILNSIYILLIKLDNIPFLHVVWQHMQLCVQNICLCMCSAQIRASSVHFSILNLFLVGGFSLNLELAFSLFCWKPARPSFPPYLHSLMSWPYRSLWERLPDYVGANMHLLCLWYQTSTHNYWVIHPGPVNFR